MKNKKVFIAIICCFIVVAGGFFAYQSYEQAESEKIQKLEKQQIKWIQESMQDYKVYEFKQNHTFDKNFKKVNQLIQDDYRIIYEARNEINQNLSDFKTNQYRNPEMIQKDQPGFTEMLASLAAQKNKIKEAENALGVEKTDERVKKTGLTEKYQDIYYELTDIEALQVDFELFSIQPTKELSYFEELLTYLSEHPNDWTIEDGKIAMTSETAYQYTTDLHNRYQ